MKYISWGERARSAVGQSKLEVMNGQEHTDESYSLMGWQQTRSDEGNGGTRTSVESSTFDGLTTSLMVSISR